MGHGPAKKGRAKKGRCHVGSTSIGCVARACIGPLQIVRPSPCAVVVVCASEPPATVSSYACAFGLEEGGGDLCVLMCAYVCDVRARYGFGRACVESERDKRHTTGYKRLVGSRVFAGWSLH